MLVMQSQSMPTLLLTAEILASPVPVISTPLQQIFLPLLPQQEIQETSPSPLLVAVRLPLVLSIPSPLMQVEGRSTSLLLEEQVRSTQLLEISLPILFEEMEGRSPSPLLVAVTLPLVL